MQLAKTSYTVTVIFILLSVILLYMLFSNVQLVIYLENIPYQKDHNGNKHDLSAFCAILGYICNNVQLRIIVLYIAE